MPDILSKPIPAWRVLIADDHALLVDGLRSLLEAHGFEIAGIVDNGQAAVTEALRLDPDLILMDIRMPICDGLAATRLIKAERPDMRILMITTSAEDEDLFEAIKSGACGYLLKSTRGADFIEALHGVEKGFPPFSPGLAERLMREFARISTDSEKGKPRDDSIEIREQEPIRNDGEINRTDHEVSDEKLTERQREILSMVASGLTYKEVGARLYLSENTVRYHMGEIMRKLHLQNRSQVIAYAGKLDL